MKALKGTRRRGFVLTPVGLKRLQTAILAVEMVENNGDRFTLDELGDRMNISSKTLSRLWSLDIGVDQKTLKLCFSTCNLELRNEDKDRLAKLLAAALSPDGQTIPMSNVDKIAQI